MTGTPSVRRPRAGGGAAFWLVPGGGKSLQSAWAPRGRRENILGEGGTSHLSITESAGGCTYQTAVPRRDGSGAGRLWLGRRGQDGGSQSVGSHEGTRAGSPRATQTLGPGLTLEHRCPSAFRCRGPAISSPTGPPPPPWSGLLPAPPPRGPSAGGCREARAPLSSPAPSSPHVPLVFPFSPLITAGWLGEEGRWPRRSLGGRLPLTREPPWEQEDGGGSSGRPGGGGAEARGAERGGGGGRERQQPVAAQQNRNQRLPRGHLSRPSRRSQ